MNKDCLNDFQESEASFRVAFQSSAIGIEVLSPDGKILQVNDAEINMLGYTREELCHRFDHENVYTEDINVGMNLFQELPYGNRNWYQVEERYVQKNGEVF